MEDWFLAAQAVDWSSVRQAVVLRLEVLAPPVLHERENSHFVYYDILRQSIKYRQFQKIMSDFTEFILE